MPKFLPLFPLQLVVYPGEHLNLHIFEDRYKELIHDIIEKKSGFGIPVFLNDRVEEYGTELELISIEKRYPDGRMDIKTRGIGIFRILEFLRDVPDKKYAAGIVSDLEFTKGDRMNTRLWSLCNRLHELMGMQPNYKKDAQDLRSYDLAHFVSLSLEDKYYMLTMLDERQRQNFLIDHLQKTIPLLEETEKVKDRIRLNGHFRNDSPLQF